MTDVDPEVRAAVYARDRHLCVSCGTDEGLTVQHREAVGMGGSAGAIHLQAAEFVTACGLCNSGFEAELQTSALQNGWKLRRFRDHDRWPAHKVPYFHAADGLWWMPNIQSGVREVTPPGMAEIIIRFANGSP